MVQGEKVTNPKVFEFAKEIGMETLTLMNKIREWKLPVRSHMAELDPDTLGQIKTLLSQETAGKKEDSKKKKVAKKATPAAESEKVKEAPAKASAASTRPAAKPVTKKAAASEEKPVAAKSNVVVKKSGPKTVVRKKDDEEIEAEIKAEELVVHVEAEVAQAEPPAPTPIVAAAPIIEKVIEEPVPPQVVAPVATPTAPAAAAAPTPTAEEAAKAAAVAPRKREVVMTAGGPVSGVRSEAPRRNIVGRMDLSRVTPPSNALGSHGGGSGPRPYTPRSAPPGRSVRPGFVAVQQPVPVDSSFEAKKRFEERRGVRPKTPEPTAPGAVRTEREEEVAVFSSTEFRKREMVFQPKKKKTAMSREAKKTSITQPKASKRVVKVDQTMKLGELAQEMGVKAAALTKVLMANGVMATMTTELDFDTISLILPEFGFEAQNIHRTVDQLIESTAFGELDADAITRPPVVTVMGHVDHGKTSLLDAIRKADVASGEAGGITQHIGAYQVKTEEGHLVTFIDTPGHEAFTAMRARGANATDIAIIVVAADDGVMPQTAEAVSHAKAAEVPIIVAINKIDKPGANPDRIKQQLTEFQLVPEEWGGDTIYCNVSALQKTGIKELLEQIYLLAEVAELKANPQRSATGIVIESRLEKGRGSVATLLVQDGTLKIGQSVVVGTIAGRVRSLTNDRGERVDEAGPSVPVELQGLSDTPQAGDRFDVCESEDEANSIAAARKAAGADKNKATGKLSLEEVFAKMKAGDLKELPIVLKSDVAGSAEAIRGMFEKLTTPEVKIKIIHSAVGGINESDVLLASTAKGIVVGFNVRPDGSATAMSKRENVEIKTYTIVYELIDDMKKAMGGLLAPTSVEKSLGRAEVRQTFSVPKLGVIAGSFVLDGKILRAANARLVRDGKIVYTGKLGSLKRFKDDVREVATGFECGIGIENYNDVKVGDIIEAFQVESVQREI